MNEKVIEYIDKWLQDGAGPQDYKVFSKLAIAMPAPCTEAVCVRKNYHNGLDLLITYRDPDSDPAFGGYYHSIGSAHMFTNYINSSAIPEFLALFPQNIIDKVRSDKTWWNLDTRGTVLLRIFRRELGVKDKTALELINLARFAGIDHTLTPRGGESAFIYLVDLTNYQDKITKQVEWMPVNDIRTRKDFLAHQIPRVEKALKMQD